MQYLDEEKMPSDLKYASFQNRFKKHYLAYLTNWEKLLLFFHVNIPCLKKVSCWQKQKDYVRLFKRGKSKIVKNLNILNIFK